MINLLPDSLKQDNKYAKYNSQIIGLFYALLAILAITSTVYVFGTFLLSKKLNTAKSDFENQSALLAKTKTESVAKSLSDSISSAATILKRERKFSIIIKQIASTLPSGSQLSGLALSNEPKQPLSFNVNIPNEDVALVIKKNIQEKKDSDDDRVFTDADIQSINRNSVTNVITVVITTGLAEKTVKPKTQNPAQGVKK
jgi:hypothetical protein